MAVLMFWPGLDGGFTEFADALWPSVIVELSLTKIIVLVSDQTHYLQIKMTELIVFYQFLTY